MKFLHLFTAAAVVLLGATAVPPQTYAAKPIRIIVSTSPGGITDILARLLGNSITTKTGQPHVIDNRAGASGNLALEAVAKAAPDGYTLGFANTGNVTVNPFLFKTMTFAPLNDLVPVGPIGTVPLFLIMNGKLPPRNLKEFIAYAKATPDRVSSAAAGAAPLPALPGGESAKRAGLDKLVFAPFRGTAPAATAVIQGEVQITFVSMGPYLQYVQNGTLRVLAAATPARMAYVPDVPTFVEEGFSGLEMPSWFALFAPRGTPREIVDQLNGYTRAVQDDPETKKRLDAQFVDTLPLTQPQFAALVKSDAAKWERVV